MGTLVLSTLPGWGSYRRAYCSPTFPYSYTLDKLKISLLAILVEAVRKGSGGL